MVTGTKIAKRWSEVLNNELTEVGKASRRLGSVGKRVYGVYAEQKVDLKDAYRQIGVLNNDLGSLREKHRAVTSEYKALLKRDIALAAALLVNSSPTGTPSHIRTPEFEQMDCDTLAVLPPARNTYSNRVRKGPVKEPAASRGAFPPFPNPQPAIVEKPIRSRLGPVPPKLKTEKPRKKHSRATKSLKRERDANA